MNKFKKDRRKSMNVNVSSYPRVYEIDANNFDSELDALLDRLLGPRVERNDSQPSVSGKQTAKAYLLEIKLPGVTEKELEVNFESGNLSIQSTPGEVRSESKKREAADYIKSVSSSTGSGKNVNRRESKINPFRKIYRLPKDADPQGISASFYNGVLSLRISKKVKII
jgi:HSP20 family protein